MGSVFYHATPTPKLYPPKEPLAAVVVSPDMKLNGLIYSRDEGG